MLVELRVSHLGVIDDQTLVLGPGMTALTGETGAGKTLLVDAIDLLAGGTADTALVRPGAEEAVVEGRFVRPPTEPGQPESEVVLTRVIPAHGRSRCYVDGRMVPLSRFGELGRSLVDLHGQHAHQSLLAPAAQRSGLDRARGIDATEVVLRRRTVRELRDQQAAFGGDRHSRARELDLLNYQLREIDAAALDDPAEDAILQAEEDVLSDAAGLVAAAQAVWSALTGDGGAVDRVGEAVAATGSRRPLAELQDRLLALQEEISDSGGQARSIAESIEEDPGRLVEIGERRKTLGELRRKYGGSLEEVIAYREDLRGKVEDLETHDQRAAELEAKLEGAEKQLLAARERLWAARRQGAPSFAQAVEVELHRLAMPRARFEVEVGPEPQQEVVTWLLGANPGEPLLPLAKVASGGELARAMLAVRLVIGPSSHELDLDAGEAPLTLVFDEVDAGIGGEAALAVGEALAALATRYQVLVVTHLAQVAAFSDAQLAVAKEVQSGKEGERTVARVTAVDGEERVRELARMLSGRPDSESARQHAEELLNGIGAGRQLGQSRRSTTRRAGRG
ncbi:MAG: DNA repair protein RecN [Acidimicrobiales bacterium]|nr:DNA repair protein RecN [Acidimicrobiales bacterium]